MDFVLSKFGKGIALAKPAFERVVLEVIMGRFRPVLLYTAMVVLVSFSHQASAKTARISLDKVTLNEKASHEPLFLNYYYKPEVFRGNLKSALEEIRQLSEERSIIVSDLKLHTQDEQTKLSSERRELIMKKGSPGFDSQGAESKWALQMYDHMVRSSLVKQDYLDRLALWDSQNCIQVDYERRENQNYVTSIRIQRAPKKVSPRRTKYVASIP